MIGWDIWKGGCIHATIPRAYADTIETLLWKRHTIKDRHSLASRDTIEKIKNIRSRIAITRATWDETAMMWQLIAGGIVGYAPMVGTPPPSDPHLEGTAFFHSIFTSLGTRHPAERSSLTAAKSAGGLQVASVVEGVVSGVANEAMYVLNSSTIASSIARDMLKEAMHTKPLRG